MAGLAGMGSLLPVLPGWLRLVLLLVLALLGPGGLIVACLGPLPRFVVAPAIPAIGVSTLSLAVTATLAIGAYEPRVTTLIVSAVCVAGGILLRGLRGDAHTALLRPPGRARIRQIHARARRSTLQWLRASPTRLPVALVIVGLLIWLGSLPSLDRSSYSSYGLIVSTPSMAVALGATVLGLLLAVRAGHLAAGWFGLVATVLVLRGGTLFATSAAPYPWTYTHLGVIDWFGHSGTLARDVDVYSNWAGTLAFFAWLSDSAAFSSFSLAHGFILVCHLLTIVAVYLMARAFRRTPTEALVAAFLVEAVNWVGQDYLSPQAVAFLLAIVLVTLLQVARDHRFAQAASVSALVIYTGIAWSHQLTATWLVGATLALVLVGFLRPLWTAIGVLGMFGLMLGVNLDSLVRNSTGISTDVVANSAGNVPMSGSPGQQLTSNTVHLLAALVWGAGFGAALLQVWRAQSATRRKDALGLAVVGFSPFALLATNYGGEAIFRVYLFSLPSMAVLVAPYLTKLLCFPGRRALLAILGALVVTAMGAQGTWGNWYQGIITGDEVALAKRLDRAAGVRGNIAYLVPGVMPANVSWRYVPRDRSPLVVDQTWGIENLYAGTDGSDPAPVDDLTYAVGQQARNRPYFVVISRSMRINALQYGKMTPGSFASIEGHFTRSGWRPVYRAADGTVIFANSAGASAWSALGTGAAG